MNDPILRTASRYLFPVVITLSLILLWRGHNLPGGGFIGGLVAAMAGVLVYLSDGEAAMRKALRLSPESILSWGLALALCGAIWGWFLGSGFFAASWLPAVYLPLIGKVLLGTPLIFDVGVYLVVIGFTSLVLLQFERMDKWST